MNKQKFFPIFLMLAFAPLNALEASPHANPLDEVLNSDKMKEIVDQTGRMKNKAKILDEPKTKYYDKRSNYGKVFEQGGYTQKPAEWLTSYLGPFKLRGITGEKNQTRVLSSARIFSPSGILIAVDVYVPHPMYKTLLENRMIPEIKNLTPEPRDTKFHETITLHGRDADLYETQKGRCSILMEAEKDSIIEVSAKRCKDFDELIQLVNLLDFARLERKLGQ